MGRQVNDDYEQTRANFQVLSEIRNHGLSVQAITADALDSEATGTVYTHSLCFSFAGIVI
jgi:hypothetical protein